MIKADLITGFLGSGKTTFLIGYVKHLLSLGLKVGILEYDYGAVNVDMLLLKDLRGDNCEIESVAAACDEDCLRRRFKTKLIAMAMSGYDRIIIEPSGVFDMDMFTDALRDEPLERWYEIGSIVAIVDANLDENLTPEEEYIVASQAACAGSIILSKSQLTDEPHIENTKSRLSAYAQKLRVDKLRGTFVTKPWDEFTPEDYSSIMNSGFYSADYIKLIAGKKLEFSSVAILDVNESLDTFKAKVSQLFSDKTYGNILRVKGFIFDSGHAYQINATANTMTVEPFPGAQPAIIIIGDGSFAEKTDLIRGLFK